MPRVLISDKLSPAAAAIFEARGVQADAADVGLVLDAVNANFNVEVTEADVTATWAGVRPLIADEGSPSPSAVSRDYEVLEGPPGAYAIVGGKLTNARAMAESVVDRVVEPALEAWVAGADVSARRRRRERVAIAFGLGKAAWDFERTLDRFELLYEAGLIAEALRDQRTAADPKRLAIVRALGAPMALDNRRILATALGRLRGKLRYRPVVFDLVPRTFTLLRLQRTVEALGGVRLHKQNFRRLVITGGLVEPTGRRRSQTGGRPAELFRFRREVLRERLAPGVGIPALRITT